MLSNTMDRTNQKFVPKLIAFGNVLLDFSYSANDRKDIFEKFHLNPNDLGECSIEQLQQMQIDANKLCIFLKSQTGGSALNTMKMLSMLNERNILFCGMVGNDNNANIVRKNLEDCRLMADLQVHTTIPTGTCICILQREHRCCYANIGASGHYDINTLKVTLPNLLEYPDSSGTNKQIIYIEGFFVTENRFPLCIYINELRCYYSNLMLACNLSAKYLIDQCSDEIKYLAENATIVFGNLGEYKTLTEKYDFKTVDQLLAHLLKPKNGAENNKRKILICTNGSSNVLYSFRFGNNEPNINRIFNFDSIPVDKIVDTTGCGDAFVAGFFYGYLRNDSIELCIGKGVELASKKLGSVGGAIS